MFWTFLLHPTQLSFWFICGFPSFFFFDIKQNFFFFSIFMFRFNFHSEQNCWHQLHSPFTMSAEVIKGCISAWLQTREVVHKRWLNSNLVVSYKVFSYIFLSISYSPIIIRLNFVLCDTVYCISNLLKIYPFAQCFGKFLGNF